jgi:hypothetical protein
VDGALRHFSFGRGSRQVAFLGNDRDGTRTWMTHVDELSVKERIEQHLDDAAVRRVARYFLGPKPHTGRRFERFAGGGDRHEVANRFTAADVVAVSMLGARMHGVSAIEILETRAEDFGGWLALVPVGVDLWEAEHNVIGRGSPADTLWRELLKVHQVSEATASKLIARKRPRLIPVYDSVVAAAIGPPYGWWAAFHRALQDPALRNRLTEIRTESNVGDDISLLRIMEVAIWTLHEHEQPEEET